MYCRHNVSTLNRDNGVGNIAKNMKSNTYYNSNSIKAAKIDEKIHPNTEKVHLLVYFLVKHPRIGGPGIGLRWRLQFEFHQTSPIVEPSMHWVGEISDQVSLSTVQGLGR